MKKLAMILALAAVFLCASPAFAQDLAIEVRVPVENHAKAGWFALADGEEVLDEVYLRSGEAGYLSTFVKTLDHFEYKVKQLRFEDGSEPSDRDEYTLHVTTFMDGEVPSQSTYAVKDGEEGKADKIAFYSYELLPESRESPQTGDSAWIGWLAAFVIGAAAGTAFYFITRKRRK